MKALCEECWYHSYDEESDEFYCELQLDEDEYVKWLADFSKGCRYFRPDPGEYGIVRKQN